MIDTGHFFCVCVFVQYDGRIDFEYPRHKLENLARRSGEIGTLVDSGVYFWLNVTDWYSGMNRTGWAGTIIASSQIKLKWVGEPIRTFKPRSTMKVQVNVVCVSVYVCLLWCCVVLFLVPVNVSVSVASSVRMCLSMCVWCGAV